MFEVGRICVKLAGRDAGMRCVIIDVVDRQNVLIDGETRRRKCNIKHLEPLDRKVEISKNAPLAEVQRVMSELGYKAKGEKQKQKGEKKKAPTKKRVPKKKETKPSPEKAKKADRKDEKKEPAKQ